MPKTLYISDLDGTLLRSNKELSNYTEENLNLLISHDVYFTIATARTNISAGKILDRLNLNVPIVVMNGVLIYDTKKETYLKIEEIPKNTSYKIYDVIKDHSMNCFMYTIKDNKLITFYEDIQRKPLYEYYHERVIKYNKLFIQSNNFLNVIYENDVIYFFLIDSYISLLNIFKKIENLKGVSTVLSRDIYSDDDWFLEIHSEKASKASAAQYIKEYFDFDKIIGFGDNHNDITLLENCDEFYSVSNAIQELREKATDVIGDNDSDSVVEFILKREEII